MMTVTERDMGNLSPLQRLQQASRADGDCNTTHSIRPSTLRWLQQVSRCGDDCNLHEVVVCAQKLSCNRRVAAMVTVTEKKGKQ